MEEKETLNVDKVIGLTFRSLDANVINFKMLQTILLIFAHRMDILEQKVDIKEEINQMRRKHPDSSLESEIEIKSVIRKKAHASRDLSTSDEADDKKPRDKIKKKRKLRPDKLTLDKAEYEKNEMDVKSEDKKEKRAIKEGGAYQSSTDDKTTSVESKYDREISVKMNKDKKESKLKRSKLAYDAQDIEKEEYGGVAKSTSGDKKIELIPSKRASSDDTQSRAGIAVSDSRTPRSASIELVTRSQFELLEMDVEKLIRQTEPVPAPSMPDNKKIKEALSKGTTTLPGSMEAVQLNARVRAAEQALARMSDLLKALADSGALPPEMCALVDQLDNDYQNLKRLMPAGVEKDFKSGVSTSPKSVGPEGVKLQLGKSRMGQPRMGQSRMGQSRMGQSRMDQSQMDQSQMDQPRMSQSRMSQSRMGQSRHAGRPSAATMSPMATVTPPPNPLVTQSGLSEAINNLKHEIAERVSKMTDNSTERAEHAANLVKSVEDQLVIALAVNRRIDNLELLTIKNAEQLGGFDTGLSTQVRNFEEQVKQMRAKLQGSLDYMTLNERVENAAVMDLKSNQERMELQVDQTLHHLTTLFTTYRHLNEESLDLLKRVNMVYDEKITRKELAKGLKQKLDRNRLEGLLMEDVFEVNRKDLNKQLETCIETYDKRNREWMGELKNLLQLSRTKVPLLELYNIKDFVTCTLRELKETLCKFELVMGDPKVALLARQLSRNAYCGSCMIAAHMNPFDKTYGKPPELPKLILDHYLKAEEEPILKLRPPDKRKYICKRWVGGSHTIITEHKTQEKMSLSELQKRPIRYYAANAGDGHIYMMQEEVEPCIQCNLVSTAIEAKHHPSTSDVGAGDQSPSNEDEYIQETASIMSIAGSS